MYQCRIGNAKHSLNRFREETVMGRNFRNLMLMMMNDIEDDRDLSFHILRFFSRIFLQLKQQGMFSVKKNG